MTAPDSSLTLGPRDAQWLVALMALSTLIINATATEDMIAHNICEIEKLYWLEYSGTEGEALKQRLYALLPLDTPIILHHVPGAMAPSTSSLVS